MLTCRDIEAQATEWAEDRLDPAARAHFDAHLAACAACRAHVQQLSATVQVLRRLPDPEPPPALEAALLAAFDRRAAAAAAVAGPALRARAAVTGGLAVAAALALFLASARHPSGDTLDWTLAAALALVALLAAAVAARFGRGAVVACLTAAAVGAAVAGGGGAVEARAGLDCLAIEVLGAGLVTGALWLATRRQAGAGLRWSATLGATVGALAADAALQVSCPAHRALAHLALFHLGGVAVLGAAALWLLRTRGSDGATAAAP